MVLCDICDFDELKTGARGEGMILRYQFSSKLAIALVTIIASAILIWVNIDGANPIISADKIMDIRIMYAIIPTSYDWNNILHMEISIIKSKSVRNSRTISGKRQSK